MRQDERDMIEKYGIEDANLVVDLRSQDYVIQFCVSRHAAAYVGRHRFEDMLNRMGPECVAVALALSQSQHRFASDRVNEESRENKRLREIIRRITGQDDLSPWMER